MKTRTIIGTIEQSDRLAASPLADGRRFYAFRGIPYAKPPLGSLRWADPELFDGPWERDRLDATKFKSFCPQYDHDKNSVLGNEDCLYLNIFTPYLPGETSRMFACLFWSSFMVELTLGEHHHPMVRNV
ncbi:Esterase SG1 [Armadillidium vulgare]|nr:Esterase SG1 [Armadillidium vulgare]